MMSWLSALYNTFENNQMQLQDTAAPLLPICHTTQQAHLEVVINNDGEFLRAYVVPREDNTTIIPCTESSSSRAGIKPVNHPLCDKLQYLAGDFVEFGGVVTKGFAKDPTAPYLTYLTELKEWEQSSFGHPKLTAIVQYVEKRTLIQDLINYCVLHVDQSDKLVDKWENKDDEPEIFKVLPRTQSQYDAFVRWRVETPATLETSVWKDQELIEAWIKYYTSKIQEKDICYVTGEETEIALLHPAKIRNDGDKAKLISGNDQSGFTFRGRFEDYGQAASVGFEVTQKAHNMLRWLVKQQGFRSGDLAIVAWAPSGANVPSPVYGSNDGPFSRFEEQSVAYTAEEFAHKLRKRIWGFQKELGNFANINVIGLDSATPGRMSISFYKELSSSQFFKNLETWHTDCSWLLSYRPSNAPNDFPVNYIGAPSLFDIAEAAYGSRVAPKLKAKTIERLLACVVDGQALPIDLVNSVVIRASNPVAFEQDWQWRKTLTIGCGLYKGANKEEEYTVALDETRDSRDYLYGRLLAHADALESWALSEAGEKRTTNAARSMSRFAERPFSTWRNLELRLEPYKVRLGPRRSYKFENGISEVMDKFNPEQFTNDKPLTGEFLLGYHSQLIALRKSSKDEDASEEN